MRKRPAKNTAKKTKKSARVGDLPAQPLGADKTASVKGGASSTLRSHGLRSRMSANEAAAAGA